MRLLLVFFNCVQSANILGVFLFPSISHQVVYQAIWKELSLKGHSVTVITPDPLNDPSLTNLTEISVRFVYDFLEETKIHQLMSKDSNMFEMFMGTMHLLEVIGEAELNCSQVKKLIGDDSKHFDLVLTELFHPVMYAWSGRFKAPIISVTSMGMFLSNHHVVGNPAHPVLFPDIMLSIHNRRLSLWEKIRSVSYHIFSVFYYLNVVVPRAHKIAVKYFGDEIPYVGDLEKNQSLVFINLNPLVNVPRPNVPSIIEMGQVHIKPVKPLPHDLKTFLDEARDGAIYFCLGSNVKSSELQDSFRSTIMEALSELPYQIVWKFESEYLPGKPSNVMIKPWLPQQDILAHPNIKVFVTQGGFQSLEEAISREVPMVGIPFMADQPMNVQKMVELGIGLKIDHVTVTKEQLKSAIIEVAQNQKYKKRAQEIRKLINDKPMTGLEKAVWWSEYVIRHKGAGHLKSPTADISWTEYLLVDVVAVVVFGVAAMVYVCYIIVKISVRKMRFKLKVL